MISDSDPSDPSDRAARIARVLRLLGRKAMSMAQAESAGKLLNLHWTTVYRLRKRFIEDPVATSVAPRMPGPSSGFRRLDPGVEQVIAHTLAKWLPRQRHLAHPELDLTLEIRARCERVDLKLPSRSTIVHRWELHKKEKAARLAQAPGAEIPPGNLMAANLLDRYCEVHGTPLATIACGALRCCENFNKTFKTVGRVEFERARDVRK